MDYKWIGLEQKWIGSRKLDFLPTLTGNSFIMGSLTKRSFFIFPVFPNISGKLSRLKQSESSSSSREGKLRGGNLLSSAHSSAINILSLVRKPTESSTEIKLAHSLKESFSKFGR